MKVSLDCFAGELDQIVDFFDFGFEPIQGILPFLGCQISRSALETRQKSVDFVQEDVALSDLIHDDAHNLIFQRGKLGMEHSV